MKKPHMIASRYSSLCASALVITLVILTLVSVLVVGMTETMRVERASANTHLERAHAVDFAQFGVDRVVGLLRTNIGDDNKSWISTPGLIVCSSGSDLKLTKEVDLYSGVSAYARSNAANCPTGCLPPNLNAVVLSDTSHHLITDRPADPDNTASKVVELPLKWIYVRQDGTRDPTEPPILTNRINPIIGRYAYWTDDESTKINYNIAWKRPLPADNPPVCSVNLLALNGVSSSGSITTVMADALHKAITASVPSYMGVKRFFNTPQDAYSLSSTVSGIGNVLESNKFELTHYNHDPDTTFFNEPRIVLTTHREYVTPDKNGEYPCIDILYDNATLNWDPGNQNNIDPKKLVKTVNKLMDYMKRTDWPMTSGTASFQSKYYSGNPDRLAQLALNIIDYVRCKESARLLVEPTRGDNFPGHFEAPFQNESFPYAFQSEYAFMGMTRTPLINEVGIWLSDDCKTAIVFVELYLPKKYGIDSMDVCKDQNTGDAHTLSVEVDGGADEHEIKESECIGGSILVAGGYKVIARKINVTNWRYSPGNRPIRIPLRIAYSRIQYNRLDVAPHVATGYVTAQNKELYKLYFNIDPIGIPESNAFSRIQSREVDDPRVSKFQSDWHASGANSFGQKNNCCEVGNPPADSSICPQQDTDSRGNISDASLYMPYPAGQGDNVQGLVTSPAELGYIHTGVQGSGTSGIPWRTLRLQPSKDNLSVVPDWAFVDLFAVPNKVKLMVSAKPIFAPHDTSVGGRVSVNAQVQPFGNKNYTAFPIPLERVNPLVAVLFGGISSELDANGTITNKALALEDARKIGRNIYDHTLAENGKDYSKANLPGSKAQFYTSPGEIVEIKDVADGGEESEMRLRYLPGLITTRGNVFSIYSIGQALKQTPTGTLVVKGEQRVQSTVERYLDSGAGTIKFRTIYFRDLTP